MALKFLNKKGWHTGSLRNIENVWKAEQKHDAEQKKLEELRKQIQEERERSEFRLLQEQAGLVPKQERLDFLYDSGLAVGKSSSEGFKSLEAFPKTQTDTPSSSSAKQQQQPSVPGALFEEKPQSANDTWRKLHSDPLLLIRQREQEALARIKNNPVQMAMIRKTVEGKKEEEKSPDRKERHKKHHHKKSKHHKNSTPKHHYDSEGVEEEERRTSNKGRSSKYDDHLKKATLSSEELHERDIRGKKNSDKDLKYKELHKNYDSEDVEEEERRTSNKGRSSKYDDHLKKAALSSEELHERGIRGKKNSDKDLKYKELHKNYDSEDVEEEERRTSNKGRSSKYDDHLKKAALGSEELHERGIRGKKNSDKDLKYKERHKNYDSKDVEEEERRTSNKGRSSKYDDHLKKAAPSSEELHERDIRGKKNSDKDLKCKESLPTDSSDTRTRQSEDKYRTKRIYDESKREKYNLEGRKDSESARKGREDTSFSQASRYKSPDVAPQDESHKKRRNIPPKLSDEERALRLREMQMDAELHEEQRWKRLKKAEEDDAQEASRAPVSSGRNFLDAAHKSVYGAEKGGSSTIEESVRRRKYYMQGRSETGDGNAFRR